MAQVPAHPLLSLPDDEIIQKLHNMSFQEMLKFSLISERCKDLVTSIQIKGVSISVRIGRDISVSVGTNSQSMNLTFYREPDMYWGVGAYGRKKKLTTPRSIIVDEYGRNIAQDTKSTWEKNELTMRNLFKHFKHIFNCHKLDNISFATDSSQFDIDDIKEVFGTAAKVHIWDTGCHVFNQMILQNLLSVEQLSIEPSNFQNSKTPERILMQNFDYLDIYNGVEEATSMSLDELLLINSKVIDIIGLQTSAKQINKFIKLWQKGSNPRLEWIAISCVPAMQGDDSVIMRGIEHCLVPINTIRKFTSAGNEKPCVIKGGMDIHRKDGVKATIRFTSSHTFSLWEMYVWFDHCVVES